MKIEDGEEPTVTDGPFAESKEQLGGFYLLECKDLDEALEYAKKIPLQNGPVEVRPVMDSPSTATRSRARRARPLRHRAPFRSDR